MLHIIGTPIGNIEDISYRAISTLLEADVILAEDTRTFKVFYGRVQDLFNMYTQKEQIVKSFYKETEFGMISEVLEMLEAGKRVALVSESGMPGISDPGAMLIKHARMNGLSYSVIPGPTAFATAAVLSGIQFKHIVFFGFLEKKETALLKQLKEIGDVFRGKDTLIACYESPHRVKKTIEIIGHTLSPKEFVICREMTKKFEEVISIDKNTDISNLHLKGEIVLLFTV